MGNPLWAPWRLEYILAPKGHTDCVFCGVPRATGGRAPRGGDSDALRARLVVATTRRAFVMLNRYPFAAGHLLVVPHAHVSALDALDPADYEALFRLVREATSRLRAAVKPDGINIGVNLGAAAGAGIAEHLHVHVVPRWAGDTNFMPVVADTRVIPQALEATRDHLLGFFSDLPISAVDGDDGEAP